MFKKAGLVIAVAAVGVLSMSPLAFAKDRDRHHGDDNEQHGLVNLSDTTAQVPVQLCGNDILSGALGVLASDLSNRSSDDVDCDQENSSD